MSKALTEAADVLKDATLFRGIAPEELPDVLEDLGATVEGYDEGEVVLAAGRPVTSIYAVVEGKVQMTEEDVFGNRTIFGQAPVGHVFAEALAAAEQKENFVTVVALEPSRVLAIRMEEIMRYSYRPQRYRDTLVRNLLHIMARRNMQLHRKLAVLSGRRTREKVLTYLNELAREQGADTFEVPMSRQELADYLCVDRSALSAELSKMRKEGLIDYKRNRFTLLA